MPPAVVAKQYSNSGKSSDAWQVKGSCDVGKNTLRKLRQRSRLGPCKSSTDIKVVSRCCLFAILCLV